MTDKNKDKKPRKPELGPLRYFAVVGQIGIVIALPLVAMIWLATYVMDNVYDSVWVLIIFVLSGLYAGFRSAYNLLMK